MVTMLPAPGIGPAGEGSSRPATGTSSTLGEAMRAPSTTTPEVVVLDDFPAELARREVLDPREDLWLSTSDGRYSCPIIPLRVGVAPYSETFYVHKDILVKTTFFKKALCGNFKESETQSIDLPEEDPAIFHFIIAFLYEGRYDPIKPIASALLPDADKGKGKDVSTDVAESDSDSPASIASDSTARSRRRRDQRRRREERNLERLRQKHPGMHRPNCNCPQCIPTGGPPCWSCGAPRSMPPAPAPFPGGPVVMVRDRDRDRDQRRRARRAGPGPGPGFMHPGPPVTPPPPMMALDPNGGRIKGEDLRTWLLAYSHDLDVYICANKFMMDDFKAEVARHVVDMLETAGSDAAQPEVLRLCQKMYRGLPEADALLKKVFARIGFLQPLLWSRDAEHTNAFLIGNPEVAAVILRETGLRRDADFGGRPLPSLERLSFPPPPPPPGVYDHAYMPGRIPAPNRRPPGGW